MRESGRLKFYVARGASAREFRNFLRDFEGAYSALVRLELHNQSRRRHRHLDVLELGHFGLISQWDWGRRFSLQPQDWLEITSASFASPSFLEFLGSLNPLQQLREYLKDHHERRKDRKWREATDKAKAELENERLETQLQRDRVSLIREYAGAMRQFGATDEQIRTHLWNEVGHPLSKLTRYQESGLLTDQSEADED